MSARRWTVAAGALTALHVVLLAVDSLAPSAGGVLGALAGVSLGIALMAIAMALLTILEESEKR